MKRIALVLGLLLLVALTSTVDAEGIENNPNSFELDMNCEGEIIHVIIPGIMANAGRDAEMMIGHVRTHLIDFEQDGIWDLSFTFAKGKGFDTVFCTWTWDKDNFLHGMDMHFVNDK